MRKIEEIRNTTCTGCSACSNICPVGAIEIDFDEKGFYKPTINKEKCINCGLCDKTCPILNDIKQAEFNPKLFAMWAKDEIRLKSSSGGAFTVFAEAILKKKGVVFGAVWDKDFTVIHKGFEKKENLEQLRKSKYIQSFIGNSFSQVADYLKNNRLVLFVGTPCQIGGLRSYIKNKNIDDKNLYCVDLFCYYVPSYKTFKKYIYDNYGPNLESFTFRHKEKNINTSYTFSYKMKNAEPKSVLGMSVWFSGFYNKLYTCEACTKCKFQSNIRYGDITLADFWGIENHDKTWEDGKGTSMIKINTQKGYDLLKRIYKKCRRIQEVPLDWIKPTQGNAKNRHVHSDYFFSLLENKVHFKKAVELALAGKKYDFGVACVQVYANYGSAFTNYALYKMLKDYGKSVLLITQPYSAEIKPDKPRNFERNPYPVSECAKYYNNQEEMKELNKFCDKFLVGSDQLFNFHVYNRIDGFVKLKWVDDEHPKLSYATSFGLNKIMGSPEEQKDFKKCIKRFDKVSVREEAAVEMVKEEFNVVAEHVMDPVFICKKEHYESLFKGFENEIETNKVFCYILDPDKEKENVITSVCEELNKEHYIVSDMWRSQENISSLWDIKTNLKIKNEIWMGTIANSDFVVTDSFHGLCYAVIFNKPFIVLHNKLRGNARFESLLKMIGYEDRLIPADTPKEQIIELAKKTIDFEKVNAILNQEKQHSIEWFEKNIIN